jgi:hypothetical protein
VEKLWTPGAKLVGKLRTKIFLRSECEQRAPNDDMDAGFVWRFA